ETLIMAEEKDRRDNRTRYSKNHYEGKRKDVPARRDDADTYPEEPSFQKLRDNIKACLSSSLKPQSAIDRGRSIFRERKSLNFERSPPLLCDLAKKNKVLPSEMRIKNLKPCSKMVVSSSDDSSSSGRTIDDAKVRGTVTIDMPAVVQSGVNERLEEEVEPGDFFKYPADAVGKTFSKYKKDLAGKWGNYVINEGLNFKTLVRPDGRIEHYQVPSLDQWKRNMDIGDDVEISYYNGTGVEVVEEGGNECSGCCPAQLNGNVFEMMRVCETLNKKWRGGNSVRQFVADDVLKYYKLKYMKGGKIGYLYSDSARLKFFNFESAGRPWCDHLVMVRGNCMQVPGEPALELLYKNFNERKKALPLLEQTAIAQTTQAETEVDAAVNMAPPLKKQKQDSRKDIRASSKGVNLKAVEQEVLDLVKRDPIRLDTQIRSSISQLSVAWKSSPEVLKVASTDRAEYEAEKAYLAEQLKERTALCEQLQKKKALWLEQLEHEKTLQNKQF
ncbi:hypothetical protein GIB67_001170, partial [Kingdonia uniflora]